MELLGPPEAEETEEEVEANYSPLTPLNNYSQHHAVLALSGKRNF